MRDKLTALKVKNAGPGTYQDGAGLILTKTDAGGKWTWRYTFAGKRRDMGLGALADVSLAEVRKARDRWQSVLQGGKDPITERTRLIAEERAAMDAPSPTFAEVTALVFEAKKAGLRGDGKRGRWMSPLDMHVLPKIGKRPIADLTQADLHQCLKPIWRKMHPTADKALSRIGIVFNHARLMGIACDPFAVEAARHMLGAVNHQVAHIPATAWQDIPALWAKLDKPLITHRCLRFMMLTCVRSEAARNATVGEIAGDVWTVPPDRVKGRQGRALAFRVPLVPEAQAVAAEAAAWAWDARLFPSTGKHGGVTSTGLEKALNDLGEAGRPHGFRTAFRTWAQDHEISYDVAETILGHSVGGRVERTYARSDLLDLRRGVMEQWAHFVTRQKEG